LRQACASPAILFAHSFARGSPSSSDVRMNPPTRRGCRCSASGKAGGRAPVPSDGGEYFAPLSQPCRPRLVVARDATQLRAVPFPCPVSTFGAPFFKRLNLYLGGRGSLRMLAHSLAQRRLRLIDGLLPAFTLLLPRAFDMSFVDIIGNASNRQSIKVGRHSGVREYFRCFR
jgi:hypothetical protein